MEVMKVNEKEFFVIKLLGHGKGGYSYLVKDGLNNLFVLKQIHHEPCSYYTFGNKIEAEINDYNRLLKCDIRMPKMIDVDIKNERILKEYIDGPSIDMLILQDKMKEEFRIQIKEMCKSLYSNNLNIDYFPTNFIVQNDLLYYVDYECNNYMEEWNFENWGSKYWYKSEEFINHFLKKG